MKLRINNEEQSHFSLSGNRLNEESRTSLVQKSRKGSKVRYDKRMNYQITNFKGVNLEELFDNDYFVFTTPVGDYVCTVAFPGVLSYLKRTAKYTERIEQVSYQVVLRALELAYENTDDLKIDCTCPDFRFRYAYYASKNGYKYGKQETRPSKITNPDDTLGATCKHLDLLLSNKNWLSKAATSINQLIRTYPEKAETYIYTPEQIEKAHNTEKKHYSRKNDKSLSDWEREQEENNENNENNESEENEEEQE